MGKETGAQAEIIGDHQLYYQATVCSALAGTTCNLICWITGRQTSWPTEEDRCQVCASQAVQRTVCIEGLLLGASHRQPRGERQ